MYCVNDIQSTTIEDAYNYRNEFASQKTLAVIKPESIKSKSLAPIFQLKHSQLVSIKLESIIYQHK